MFSMPPPFSGAPISWSNHSYLWHQSGGGTLNASPVTSVSFDPLQERLWATDNNGYISSYTYPACQLYSSCRLAHMGHPGEDDKQWGVVSSPDLFSVQCATSGVVACAGYSIKAYDRGGVLDGQVSAAGLLGESAQFSSVATIDSNDSLGMPLTQRILAGSTSGQVMLLDSSRMWGSIDPGHGLHGRSRGGNKCVARAAVGHDVSILTLAEHKAVICASKTTGEVTLLDSALRSPAPIGKYTAHVGGLSGLATQKGLIVSGGFVAKQHSISHYNSSNSGAKHTYDACLKVFDLRMMRQTTPIVLPHASRFTGPVALHFFPDGSFPKVSANTPAAIVCNDGSVYTCDVFGDAAVQPLAHIDAGMTALQRAQVRGDSVVSDAVLRLNISCASLSPSGKVIAAADADGCVHFVSLTPEEPASLYRLYPEPATLHHDPAPWMLDQPKLWERNDLAAATPHAAHTLASDKLLTTASGARNAATAFAAAINARHAGVPSALGSSFTAHVEAAVYAGTGHEVPVDAPGLSSIVCHAHRSSWENVWSTAATTVAPLQTADMWFKLAAKSHRTHGYVPALSAVSTLPAETNDVLLIPRKHLEVDPVLLTYSDKSGSFIDNRQPSLFLRPNSLVFGRKKAYIDADFRHSACHKSTLGIEPHHSAAATFVQRPRADSLSSGASDDLESLAGDMAELGDDDAGISRIYKKPRARMSFLHFDSDFSEDNKTIFAGMEDFGLNTFVNAAVQALFFTRPFRRRVHAHLCAHPACITCELRFLFDFLAQSPFLPAGQKAATAQNLIRAMQVVPDVKRLGILHPCTLDAPRRMELLCRTIMEKVEKDLDQKPLDAEYTSMTTAQRNAVDRWRGDVDQGTPDRLCGLPGQILTKCSAGHTTRRDAVSSMLDLIYSETPSGPQSFLSLLQASIIAERKTKAWCDQCKNYVPLTLRRVPHHIPPLMIVNTKITDPSAKYTWTADAVKAPGWLAPRFSVRLGSDGVSVSAGHDSSPGSTKYEMVGVIYHINAAGADAEASAAPYAEDSKQAYHYVFCGKVGNDGAFSTSPSDQWYAFNDFRITPISEAEATDCTTLWKVPCVLFYQKVPFDHPRAFEGLKPADQDAIVAARRANNVLYPDPRGIHAMMMDVKRIPVKLAFSLPPSIPHQPLLGASPPTPNFTREFACGEVVAIDAEFVATSTEKSRVLPDGSRRILEPAVLSPGRVSVVDERGDVIFDHYIAAMEPVVDHLTRFSGLQAGDLDPQTSRHRLHTFKDSYLKLRALIDAGCIFVGHGLRKDFRTLHVLVPPKQIIDTVMIFKLEAQRNLSLKFLAHHVLHTDIQGTIHDSSEDAIMALQLYQKYKEIVAADAGITAFDALLQNLYAEGRKHGFKATHVKAVETSPAAPDTGSSAHSTSAGPLAYPLADLVGRAHLLAGAVPGEATDMRALRGRGTMRNVRGGFRGRGGGPITASHVPTVASTDLLPDGRAPPLAKPAARAKAKPVSVALNPPSPVLPEVETISPEAASAGRGRGGRGRGRPAPAKPRGRGQ